MSKKDVLFQYKDGVCSYEYVTINGIKQYIQIRGKSKTNPVLLVIHGGPGGAMSGLTHIMQQKWEEKFTVVNFDQRNSGKTYVANKERTYDIGKTGTLDDYIKDVDEVIKYIHTKYDFDKLYVMGFSWGSVVGAEYVKRNPQNVLAYIGVGQLVNYEKAFKFVCKKAMDKAKEANCVKDERRLAELIDKYPEENVMTAERMTMVRTFAMLANKYLVKNAKTFPIGAILSSPFMKFKEKKAMFLSDINLYQKTYETMLSYDFTNNMKFDVPVYFMTGDEDVNCPLELIQEQIDNMDAPRKKLFVIERASHMCFYDNPEMFNKILIDIISTNNTK